MTHVKLEGVWKYYGNFPALRGIDLEIKPGELLVVLGPSGAGKTTLLKVIAGILKADRGKIYFDGKDVTNLEPFDRNIGFVFQSPALFPHLRVWENIAFPLEARGYSFDEIKSRVIELIELVELKGLENRYPHELSGGQQQRVAIARALAAYPRLLLLDEPFANLDVQLRERLRILLRSIQKRLKITTIFVTHDQEEAFQLADRIAILMDGKIEQVGTPDLVYENPANEEVAKFLGINVVDASIFGRKGKALIWPEKITLGGKIKAKVEIILRTKWAYKVIFRVDGEKIEALMNELPNLNGEVMIDLGPVKFIE